MTKTFRLSTLMLLTVAALSACSFSGQEFPGAHTQPERIQESEGEGEQLRDVPATPTPPVHTS